VLDPAPDRGTIRLTHERAMALLPGLKDAPITAAWGGYIDSTPDGVPAIGEVATLPGLILAAGFSGHGFGIGPGAGHLIADLITAQTPIVDPRPYHPSRFAGFAAGTVADF
jgi:glycine/D-amino acid oxidase-like deaminating enzyme